MYGYRLLLSKYGITLIVNGWWLAFFKNLDTEKWQFKFTQNVWRKTKTPKPTQLGY